MGARLPGDHCNCRGGAPALWREEAAGVGFYEAPDGTKYPKLQIFTISELLDGKEIDYPRYVFDVTHKKAQRRSKQRLDEQTEMEV